MFEYVVMVFCAAAIGTALAKWYGGSEYTWQEVGCVFAGVLLICSLLLAAGTYTGMGDTAVVNGKVTSKEREKVHCRHSYQCHCYTTCSGSGNNRHCSQHCSTCYDHSYDIDWTVGTTVGNHSIDTIDRQGLREPPRWTAVKIGEPAHDTREYTNYIKGAPESLFNHALLVQNKYVIPQYPSNIYDYYRINRVVEVGVVLKHKVQLNEQLNLLLRDLGPRKQVNIVPVFTSYDSNFARVLEAKWLGGKKNDVVVVVGLNKDQSFSWVYVFSWSKQSIVNYQIQNAITDMGSMDVNQFVNVVGTSIDKSFVRKSMKEFEYLKNDISPPTWCVILALLLAFFGAIGLGYYFGIPNNRSYY